MENLLIGIGADTKEFINGLSEVGEKTSSLEDKLKGVGVAAGVAFAGYTASIMGAVYAYREEELIGQKVMATIEATGGVAGVTAKMVDEMAESFSKSTTFSKTQVSAAEAVLLTFDEISKETFPKATQATLDLAQGMGGDAAGAARLLGRALEDPMAASSRLAREGIILTAQQKAQIEAMELAGNMAGAQAIIIGAVEQKYGGMAKAAAGGTGQIVVLKNAMEEMAAKIGSEFAPFVAAAATKLTALIRAASEHEGLLQFIAATAAVGAAMTGAIAALAAGSFAFGKLTAAMEVAGAAMTALGVTTRALVGATGIGLILIATYEIYENWNRIWPAMQAVYRAFVENIGAAAQGLYKVINGAFKLDMGQIREGLAQAAAAFSAGSKTVGAAFQPTIKASPQTLESAATAGKETAMAENRARILAARAGMAELRSFEAQAQRASNAATMLELEHHTTQVIALKKREAQELKTLADANFKGDRAALKAALAETQAEYDAAYKSEAKARQKFESDYLKRDKNFQKLSVAEQKAYLSQHEAQLVGTMQSESQAQQAVITQDIERKIAADNRYLQEQVRFGTTYAAINRAMHEEILTQSEQAFSTMAEMQNSSNKTLKGIGQAAAAIDMEMKTIQAALNVYAGFCTIPIIGPELGIAAAAVTMAYGQEKTAKILGMSDGGLVTGGIPGVDSVPAMLAPGELVVPKQNFNEVVSAAASTQPNAQMQPPQQVQVMISFKGDAAKMLTAQINQSQALGTTTSKSIKDLARLK